jgi:16S rRNA (guanine1207-N2)-methyltransferase
VEPISQLILRNADLLHTGQILMINPPCDSAFRRLVDGKRHIRVFSQEFGDFNCLKSNGADAEFGLFPSLFSDAQDIVLKLPRERERLEMLLHALASSIHPESVLWLAGENRSGIKSSVKRIDPYFQSVFKIDSARHCVLFKACNPILSKSFDLDCYKKTWPLTFSGSRIKIVSLPGTFAHGKPDQGTRLLLGTMEKLKPSGKVLDFACGNGIIGLSLNTLPGALEVTLLDVSALALESARCSLQANGMEAVVVASDGLSQLEGSFDWIISNPPFHRANRNDLNIARNFFANSRDFLLETGKILLVCNNHLPYLSWLRDFFKQVDVVEANGRFKVVLATGIRR